MHKYLLSALSRKRLKIRPNQTVSFAGKLLIIVLVAAPLSTGGRESPRNIKFSHELRGGGELFAQNFELVNAERQAYDTLITVYRVAKLLADHRGVKPTGISFDDLKDVGEIKALRLKPATLINMIGQIYACNGVLPPAPPAP